MFELLTDHGYVRPRDGEERGGPGRKPSQAYDINPALYERQSAPGGVVAFALDPLLLITPPAISENGTQYRALGMGEPLAPPDDDAPLFDDEVSAYVEPAAPPAQEAGLSWDYLRQRFAAADTVGIHRHCAIHRADFHTVLAQLETEASV